MSAVKLQVSLALLNTSGYAPRFLDHLSGGGVSRPSKYFFQSDLSWEGVGKVTSPKINKNLPYT